MYSPFLLDKRFLYCKIIYHVIALTAASCTQEFYWGVPGSAVGAINRHPQAHGHDHGRKHALTAVKLYYPSPADMAGPQAFTVLQDAALTSEARLACWCPTMDLCAVATADGSLHLHRLNWQTLWVTSPEPLVSALAWRPDGKMLAVGTSLPPCGLVVLVFCSSDDHNAVLDCGTASCGLTPPQ